MQNKNGDLIIVNYNGVIQENSNEILESSILYQLNMVKNSKGILVSLSGAIYENDPSSLILMIKYLDKLNKKLGISISIIDYKKELYQILEKITKKSKIKLFKNMNAANLFLDPQSFKQNMRVLVYDKNVENSKKLSRELAKYGYDIVRAEDSNEFKAYMKNEKDYDIIITHSALNMDFSGSKSSQDTLMLSKKLIVNLPVFMDTAVESLVSFTGLKAEKSSHGIKRFDKDLDIDIICAIMKFNGDVDGFFTLVFPKDIAIITMESLLGGSVSEDDIESLKDGVGEFCNIITGSIKTVLLSKDINITFDLPKTYASLEETDNFIGHNNGVWIDMQLEGKPFYMFITK